MVERYKFVDTNNFNKVNKKFNTNALGNKNFIVFIYADWCPHCKEMKPEWEKAVNTFKDNQDLVLVEINSDSAGYLGTKYPDSDLNKVVNTNLFGFPTIRQVSPKVRNTYKIEEISLPNRNSTELESLFKSVSNKNSKKTAKKEATTTVTPKRTTKKETKDDSKKRTTKK